MDIRVLKYFLAVAREGNITKAAQTLHITQPTLSRQLMDLEKEIGAELLQRSNRQVTLTESGILFQQRAKEIILLLERMERDLADQQSLVGGTVSIACVESSASAALPGLLEKFSARHPMVQYELYSADGDDIREKIDRGAVDLGILVEPVETAKYDYFRLPYRETWGLLVPAEDPLAEKDSIQVEELRNLPLLVPRRQIVREEIASWLGIDSGHLNIYATSNLLNNKIPLVRHGLGYAVTIRGAWELRQTSDLRFVPFSPERIHGHMLVWKKNRIFSPATKRFIDFLQKHFLAEQGR